MVPGTLGPCPFRLLGPWDLVPSGYWDHGILSLEAIGTLGDGPFIASRRESLVGLGQTTDEL